MNAPFTIQKGTPSLRKEVEGWLHGLDRLSTTTREKVIDAWVTTWLSSSHADLLSMPWAPGRKIYSLARHVNDVTRLGIMLAEQSNQGWGTTIDWENLICCLILHDVDKPLLYRFDEAGEAIHSDLFFELPHGAIGGMLVNELGFPLVVVSAVTTHPANSPWHGSSIEAQILHYADLFAADHALRTIGKTPVYLVAPPLSVR